MKRFWTQVLADPVGDGGSDGWRILLDGRPVRLPGGAALLLPDARLAEAVAAEWQAAGGEVGGEMSFADVPLTRIAGTAQERIAPDPAPVIAELAGYGGSDLLCYRAAAPPALVERQAREWQPWLDWARRRFGAELVATEGIMPIAQDPVALERLAGSMARLSPFVLGALGVIVPALGSLVLGLALADSALDAEAALRLATLDERFQEEFWGADDQALLRRSRIAEDVGVAARLLGLLRP